MPDHRQTYQKSGGICCRLGNFHADDPIEFWQYPDEWQKEHSLSARCKKRSHCRSSDCLKCHITSHSKRHKRHYGTLHPKCPDSDSHYFWVI